jgi:hypothetical protein
MHLIKKIYLVLAFLGLQETVSLEAALSPEVPLDQEDAFGLFLGAGAGCDGAYLGKQMRFDDDCDGHSDDDRDYDYDDDSDDDRDPDYDPDSDAERKRPKAKTKKRPNAETKKRPEAKRKKLKADHNEPTEEASNPDLLSSPSHTDGSGKITRSCPLCGYTTTDRSNFSRHERIHKGPEGKPYQCPRCPRRFVQSTGLNSHIGNIHPQLAKKTYKCFDERCKFTSTSLHAMGRHKIAHLKGYIHMCDRCGWLGLNKNTLKTHRKHAHMLVE